MSRPSRGASFNDALRNCCVNIDPNALQHNLTRVRQLAPGKRVMAVIKANAYGHGMFHVADVLCAVAGVDAFAVATANEAFALCEQGCEKPITVFHGFSDLQEITRMAELNIRPVIHSMQQINMLDSYRGNVLDVWLKLDTGMHRLGIDLSQLDNAMQRLQQHPAVASIDLFSHFANADEPGSKLNASQIEATQNAGSHYNGQLSLANSAAICAIPQSHFDWVRPGIMLYGASPLLGRCAEELDLHPVMQVTSSLMAVQHFKRGDAIGYGSSWQCPQDMAVGIVAAGYGDGYPRHAQPGTPVLVNGQMCPLVARVSMDSLYVDLRDVDAKVGDEVELWGRNVPVNKVADAAGTICYELLCAAGAAAGLS